MAVVVAAADPLGSTMAEAPVVDDNEEAVDGAVVAADGTEERVERKASGRNTSSASNCWKACDVVEPRTQ